MFAQHQQRPIPQQLPIIYPAAINPHSAPPPGYPLMANAPKLHPPPLPCQHIPPAPPVQVAGAHMMRPVQQWLPFQKIPRASGLGLADSSASSSSAQSWVPDVYTPPFVSDYQRSINTMDAVTIRALHPPEVNFARFVEQFSGRGFLAPLKPVPRLYAAETGIDRLRGGAIPIVNPVSGERVGKKKRKGRAAGPRKELEPVETFELGPGNYEDHFSKLLRVEIETDDQLIQTYNMYSVSVIPQDVTQSLYQVFTPGIRENTPHVQLGDMIKLRQIRPMSYHGAFTGYEYETYIYGMDKSVGYVVLRADGLWIEVGGKFNVIFGVQEHRWDSARRAISDVGRALKPLDRSEERPKEETPKDAQESQFLRRMLFPEKSDGVMQYGLSRGVFSRSWIDAELNYEQQKAVDSILRQDYGSIPFLISGPPGTGKTKTIVEAVLQLIYETRSPRHHILLCAPSQEAADTLALRLAKHLGPTVLFRLQSSARTFSEVPSRLMVYSFIEGDMFALPEWKKLMRFRVIVCSCRDAGILVEARCTNRDLGRWEKSVVDSLRGIAEDSAEFVELGEPVRLHWSALLLDEAAQGMEPDVAIPLSVVAPPEDVSDDRPIVVMAGDQKQLGPTTVTKGDLQISAFERLFARQIYSEHPLRRELFTDYGMERARSRSEDVSADRRAKMLPYLYPAFTNLVRNYRSHSAILAVPSAFFYNDTLVPEAKETHRLEGWSGWKGSRGIPIKFIGHDGHDESHEEGISFYNLREVELAVKTVQSLLSPDSWPVRPDGQEGKAEEPLAQGEIAVMSPFREQVKRLRKAFRMASLKHVNVGPVEAYQGSEYRFVIICTTRARERFLGKDRDKGVGLVFEHRRVNVALTRAKEGLVVIGNPWILERDSIWMEWMNFAWRHGAVEFDGDAPPVATPRSPLDANKENQGPRKQAASIVSGVSSGAATPLTYASIASAGKSRPVGEWAPQSRGGDIEISGLVSRLETALVFKSKARDGCVFGFNAGWDEDDPMFLAGITAEEEVRKRMDDEADEGYGLGITG